MGNPASLPDNDDDDDTMDSQQDRGYYKNPTTMDFCNAGAFQRAICSLVRYAPTRARALKYLCFFLNKVGPSLRTANTESIMLNNIIFLYAKDRAVPGVAEQALDFIKIGLERNILNAPAEYTTSFSNAASVFRRVSEPILRQLNLTFSHDRRSLVRASSNSRLTH